MVLSVSIVAVVIKMLKFTEYTSNQFSCVLTIKLTEIWKRSNTVNIVS